MSPTTNTTNKTAISEETRQLEMAEETMHLAMSMLPDEVTAEYREACRFVPELIRKESDPRWFLSFHPSDPTAAALRLANYWKKRKEIFKERAFLPLNLSGTGALTQEDVRVLRTGAVLNLPRDEKNRTVMYVDTSKRRQDITPSLRSVFFLGQCFMENETTRSIGFVAIFNVSNPFAANFHKQNQACAAVLIKECMPIKEPALHFCCVLPLGMNAMSLFINTVFSYSVNLLGSLYGKSIFTHLASSKEDCLAKLIQHDFSPKGLPVSLGGSCTGGCEPWRKRCAVGDDELTLEVETDLSCLFRNALWLHNQTISSCHEEISTSSAYDSGGEVRVLEHDRKMPASSSATTHHQVDARAGVQPPINWAYSGSGGPLLLSAMAIDPSVQHIKCCAAACAPTMPSSPAKNTGVASDGRQRAHDRVETVRAAKVAPTDTTGKRRAAASTEDMQQQDKTEEDKRARRRRMHAEADRLRRAKEKIKLDSLKDQVSKMSKMNQSLKDEQQRLEGLVQAAIGMTRQGHVTDTALHS